MTAGAVPAAASPPGDGLDRRVSALGMDTTAAPWVAARVDAYLGGMLRRLGLDGAGLRDRFPLELLEAEVRCATCDEVGRCRRFLAGADDRPASFCPNISLLEGLRPRRAATSPPTADVPAAGGEVAALVRITLPAGKSAGYREAVADGVHRALVETFAVPEDGALQLVVQPGAEIVRRGRRAADIAVVEVTAADTRSAAQKRAFRRRVVELLGASPGIGAGEVVVSLVEVPRESWLPGIAA